MIAIWYAVVSFMLIVYVVLDGRNFGAGMLQWFVARTPEERRQVIAAIGPLWTWHEVWLLGFGGTLIAIFPAPDGFGVRRLLSRALSDLVVSDFARYLARSRRTHQRSPLAGISGISFSFFPIFFSRFFSAQPPATSRAAFRSTHRGISRWRFSPTFSVRGHVGLLDWYTVSIAILRCRNAGSSWRDVSHAQDRRPGPRPQRKTARSIFGSRLSRCFLSS